MLSWVDFSVFEGLVEFGWVFKVLGIDSPRRMPFIIVQRNLMPKCCLGCLIGKCQETLLRVWTWFIIIWSHTNDLSSCDIILWKRKAFLLLLALLNLWHCLIQWWLWLNSCFNFLSLLLLFFSTTMTCLASMRVHYLIIWALGQLLCLIDFEINDFLSFLGILFDKVLLCLCLL